MVTATIKVEGMSCGHCEIAVKEAIRKLPGIKKVNASKRKSQATIQYDEAQVTLDEIIKATRSIGYDGSG